MDGHCRLVKHTCPALPAHLNALGLVAADKSEEDEQEEIDEEQEEGRGEDSSDSEFSEEECSDSN